jgi:cytosine/adenosine deaminase-related metal-dependent hydrolase
MRLGSGIAPIREYIDAGVRVSLAVDGSASNDSSHMLAEARMALLLQRVTKGASALTVEEALELGTMGGARVLGRDDLGSLEPGKAADMIGIDLDRLEFAGAACHDPMGALLMCTPPTVDFSIIDGRIVVQDGQIPGYDLERAVARQNELALEMVQRAQEKR